MIINSTQWNDLTPRERQLLLNKWYFTPEFRLLPYEKFIELHGDEELVKVREAELRRLNGG